MQSKRHDGSGKWLLQHKQFCIWHDSTKLTANNARILLCYGIPGSGKTIIRCLKSGWIIVVHWLTLSYSSVVIDHLISRHGEKHVAYIYGDYRDQPNQTLVNIIGSLLKQLLTVNISNVPDAVISLLESTQEEGKRLGKRHMLQIVKSAVPQLNGPSFLCIDALDELEPRVRHELLKVLQSEFVHSRIFLTGRPHIRSEVSSVFQAHHDPINITADLGDVRAYLIHEIELDMEVNPEDMNGQLKEEILEAIINQAKGM